MILAFSALLASLPFLPKLLVNPLNNKRWASTDQYHGKTLSPTNYTVIPNVFIQDDPSLNATGYNLLNDSFGLIDKSSNRWKNFTQYITQLNKDADEYTTYKVVYIARHGEGYHNQAESFYGTPAWNCYWSLQYTDGNITWGPDAILDTLGEQQAQAVNAGWKEQIADGIPLPETLYSSPMRRAAQTVQITWNDILLNKGYVPYIKEQLRESIGLHTCDQRSNRSVIEQTFPGWHLDPSFTYHDEQWNEIYQESSDQEAQRIRLALNAIFAEDPATFISITCHSGVINAFFKAVGHRAFQVQTGGFVPVVLKAVSYPTATMAVITGGQSQTAPLCTADPTSLVRAPATVTVQPTWYPDCATSSSASSTTTSPTGCAASPVTSDAAKATSST